MFYCPKCGIKNDEDSFFCKRCGFPLDEEVENYNQTSNKKQKREKTKIKTKHKTKHKTKIKYKEKKNKQKGKMSFFQSFMMFFFILLSICGLALAAFLGYYIYQKQNIIVPNVEGYTYEYAENRLKEAHLQVQKIEIIDEQNVGIVIKQNKKANTKVMENTIIKLTVGKLDSKITMPNVEKLSLDEAINILNKHKIKYEIEYKISTQEENTVLKQSIKAGKKIEKDSSVIIIVSKTEENTETNENNDIIEDNENNTQNQT